MSLDPPALRLELYLSWQMLAKCQRQGLQCHSYSFAIITIITFCFEKLKFIK